MELLQILATLVILGGLGFVGFVLWQYKKFTDAACDRVMAPDYKQYVSGRVAQTDEAAMAVREEIRSLHKVVQPNAPQAPPQFGRPPDGTIHGKTD